LAREFAVWAPLHDVAVEAVEVTLDRHYTFSILLVIGRSYGTADKAAQGGDVMPAPPVNAKLARSLVLDRHGGPGSGTIFWLIKRNGAPDRRHAPTKINILIIPEAAKPDIRITKERASAVAMTFQVLL
jgi:hypothetical protein